MKKLLRFSTSIFLLTSFLASAQDIVWTGSASNNDFFDEANWRNSSTNVAPTSGSINPAVAINLPLRINNATPLINAIGEINLGNGSLHIANANLRAGSFSGAGSTVTVNESAYIDLTDAVPFKSSTPRVLINFTSGLSWVRTLNVNPRTFALTYLPNIKVNGGNSTYKTNLRMDNYYLAGCAVRPNLITTAPLTVYDNTNLQGASASITVDVRHRGTTIAGNMNNKMESFVLKKGYMVTIASNEDGTGKSKNYIASESDLIINQLPHTLRNMISFIRVMPWNWVTKKGFNAAPDANLNVTWRYQWNPFEDSPFANEFVPMSWGQGTANDAGVDRFTTLYNTTHLLSFNEPDDCHGQSGQYGNPKLCVIDEAVKWHKNLMKTGMRIISPGGREEAPFGWLKDFHKKATEQDVRIDVLAVHWYDWGSNPTVNTNPTALQVFNRFKSYLTNVHNLYGLPIWITEFNANPARSQAINAGFLELALPYLESLDYVERYCWFPFNTGTHFTTGWDEINRVPTNTVLSLVGNIYKNINNTAPVNSAPAIPEATIDQNNNLELAQFPNVALNKIATANSSYGPNNLPPRAVDGDVTATQWFVNFGVPTDVNFVPLPAWLEVDLQGNFTIDGFRIYESARALKDFNFQIWDSTLNDGSGGWSNTLTVTNNPATPLITYRQITPVTTSKVRLLITGHNSTNYLRLFELEVYGYEQTTLSNKQIQMRQPFTLYPNPVNNGFLNIKGDIEIESVEVYNILGTKMNVPYEDNKLQVDKLASGVHFLRINNKYSVKFIKE